MPIRTAGPPTKSSCSSWVISAIVPSAGETHRPGSCGTRRRRIAEEIDDQPQHRRRQQGQIPPRRQRRPESSAPAAARPSGAIRPRPTGKRESIAASGTDRRPRPRSKRRHCGNTSGRADRGSRAVRPRQSPCRSSAIRLHIAGPKMRQPPPPPASPGQLDPIADSAPRLHAANVLRQRLGLGPWLASVLGPRSGCRFMECKSLHSPHNTPAQTPKAEGGRGRMQSTSPSFSRQSDRHPSFGISSFRLPR